MKSVLFRILIISVFFFFFLPSLTLGATINKPTNYLGMLGYWTFDGKDMVPNVRDVSGSGNHGNLFGQVSTTTVPGRIGQALQFDGTNDYVNLGNFNSISTSAKTLSFWLKPDDITNDRRIISNTGDTNFTISINAGEMKIWHDTLPANNGYTPCVTTPGAVNIWSHYTVVFDGAGGVTCYMNGEVKQSSATNESSWGTLGLGAQLQLSFGNYYDGSMDDVRIYNRALSSTEIIRLYNHGGAKVNKSPNSKVTNGLIGLWTFDGADMIPNVRDVSGSGNHGNLSGQTSTTTVPGRIGQALLFDGTNDCVNTATINLGANAPQSASFWVKTSTTGRTFLTHGQAISLYLAGVNTFQSWMNNDATSFTMTGLGNNEWHHVVWVYDGTVESVYFDGNQAGSPSTESAPSVNAVMTIAAGTNCGSEYVNGAMDDVRLYNRALSVSEIKQLYNQGTSKVNASKNTKSTSSLVGLWTFDGADMISNVTDRSGQGNNGMLSGQTSTTTVPGRIGQALLFDGTNDFVDVPDNVYSDVTVCSWIKLNTLTPDSAITGGGGITDFFIIYDTTGLLSVYDGTQYRSVTTAFTVNTWGHACMTYIGSTKELSIYMNGVREYNNVGSATYANGTIAKIGDNGSYRMHGSMDDVRVYSRALSATEIKQIYNLGR